MNTDFLKKNNNGTNLKKTLVTEALWNVCLGRSLCWCAHAVSQDNYRNIEAVWAETYRSDDPRVSGKIQQHQPFAPLCLANFSLGFYSWDTYCSAINCCYFIKKPLRVAFDLPMTICLIMPMSRGPQRPLRGSWASYCRAAGQQQIASHSWVHLFMENNE